MSLTYDEFIKQVPAPWYGRFIENDMIHHGFTYEMGLNEDTRVFNPNGSCKKGGLYFTIPEHMNHFKKYGDNVAIIELCKDAQFYIDPKGNKYKTDKFIIRQLVNKDDFYNGSVVSKLPIYETKNEQHDIAPKNPSTLQYSNLSLSCPLPNHSLYYIINPSPATCLQAVQRDWNELQFVPNQTPQICATAVMQNKDAIKYVKSLYLKSRLRIAILDNDFSSFM
jgi:hypothetical protein